MPDVTDVGAVVELSMGWLSVTTKDGKSLIRPIIVEEDTRPVSPQGEVQGGDAATSTTAASETGTISTPQEVGTAPASPAQASREVPGDDGNIAPGMDGVRSSAPGTVTVSTD